MLQYSKHNSPKGHDHHCVKTIQHNDWNNEEIAPRRGINILLKIPVKSLMRIKCLSKSCYFLVQSSTFVNLHLNRAINIEKKFEVYDLVIDCWSELDPVDQKFPTLYWSLGSQMFYKGACHWIAITTNDPLVILSFDLSTETFCTSKIPNNCYFINELKCGLALLNDCF